MPRFHANLIHATVQPLPEHIMREYAARAGFAPNLRTRRVGTRPKDHFVVSQYVTKHAADVAVRHGIVPVSFSHNARPGEPDPT
jgi:hypothetical protein